MGATISYFLIGIAIGTITLVLMATIGRVNKLQKLIDNLATISENAVIKLGQHDRKITDLLLLIEETAQKLNKVIDKLDKYDQTFIAHRIMIDHLNKKIIKLGTTKHG